MIFFLSSEYKSNGSIDIESGLETTKESQNLRKSTFAFSSVTLVGPRSESLKKKKRRDWGKRCINDGMWDSNKIRAGMRDQDPPFQTLLQ